ncbi:MAG TPA: hypothetical protein VLC09_14535 [Polyangiaceae bacterium]|nr:hypothetical protein [Polyangiaceae bacterium]
MEALWHLLEKADRAAIVTLDRLDRLRGREPFRARIEDATKDVRAPQRVIEFDK